MMINDNDVTLCGPTPHLGNEALLPCRAFLAGAGIGAGVEFVPERACLRKVGEFCAVARLRGLLPGRNDAVLLDFVKPVENWLIGEIVKLPAAQIVVASFHVADAESTIAFREERLLEEGNIFVEELLLEVLGACGNDHALAGANRRH